MNSVASCEVADLRLRFDRRTGVSLSLGRDAPFRDEQLTGTA